MILNYPMSCFLFKAFSRVNYELPWDKNTLVFSPAIDCCSLAIHFFEKSESKLSYSGLFCFHLSNDFKLLRLTSCMPLFILSFFVHPLTMYHFL